MGPKKSQNFSGPIVYELQKAILSLYCINYQRNLSFLRQKIFTYSEFSIDFRYPSKNILQVPIGLAHKFPPHWGFVWHAGGGRHVISFLR